MTLNRFHRCVSAIALFTALGCGSEEEEARPDPLGANPSDAGDVPPAVLERPETHLTGDCNPLVPDVCLFPFPSDVYLTEDPNLPSGKRVSFPAAALPGTTIPDPWHEVDGYSPGVAPMTYLPGATVTGLPLPTTIAESLEDDCPTVLIDAETGERIPHFSELDMSDPNPEARRAFMIRPTRRLKDHARYVVAIRNVVDAAGDPLEPSPAFAALRDGTSYDDPDVEGARSLYEYLFGELERAGVARDDLQIAWDFTTATRENNTRRMLAMRDDALAQVGAVGPSFENLVITENFDADTARRIDGEMVVPLYLDGPGAGASMVLDDAGLPQQNGTARYPFVVLIPHSALAAPAPPLAVGHGLLGTRDQATGFTAFANQYNYVLFAVDWIGMASDDVGNIVALLQEGAMHKFGTVADRLQQGFLNFLLATRMMTGGLAADPATQPTGVVTIDTTRPLYYGGSQGGIYGACIMGISTDFERGALAVPGQPYSLLLNRSVDFNSYLGITRTAVPDAIDIQIALGLTQMLWDRAEPNGYSAYIRENTLPGTPEHEIIMIDSLGDHQVTTLGAHIMARTIGAKLINPAVREIFELEIVDPPHRGSGFVEFDFGNPPDPLTNTPPDPLLSQDPHGRAMEVPAAGELIDHFLQTGEVGHFCDGVCDPG